MAPRARHASCASTSWRTCSDDRGRLRPARSATHDSEHTTDEGELERLVGVLHAHCDDVGRDRSEVAVTVLDLPVVGTDRNDVWARVEVLGSTLDSADSFALHPHVSEQAHPAGG